MTRILIRAHKDPFRVETPQVVHKKNLIGDNVGNLLFSNASYKLLQVEGSTVRTGRLMGGRAEAEKLNAEVDHVVIPLANAFRPSFAAQLDRMSEAIEALTVPVTVLGVGAQLHLDGHVDRLDRMRDSVDRFMRAVLDRSPSVGVRGEYTEQYLRGLGYRDVETIGCPSMFMKGPAHRVVKRVSRLTSRSRISLNLTPYVKDLGPLVVRHARVYPRLRYAAQHRAALELLLDPALTAEQGVTEPTPMPTHRAHPLLAARRTSTFVDPAPWLEYLARFDFSFGTRIHGNIAAMLAGTPSYVLAHDSRTLELARYYDIPHRITGELTDRTDAAELYAEADYSAFNARLGERFDVFAAFLDAHGLRHVYQPGEDPARFDRRIAETAYPGAIDGRTRLPRPTASGLLRRLPGRRPVPARAKAQVANPTPAPTQPDPSRSASHAAAA